MTGTVLLSHFLSCFHIRIPSICFFHVSMFPPPHTHPKVTVFRIPGLASHTTVSPSVLLSDQTVRVFTDHRMHHSSLDSKNQLLLRALSLESFQSFRVDLKGHESTNTYLLQFIPDRVNYFLYRLCFSYQHIDK